MATRRAPWWMFVIAASFLLYASLLPYGFFRGPVSFPVGLEMRFSAGCMVVCSVAPSSEAERAGLRIGDRLIAVDGQLIRGNREWQAADANAQVGKPQRWEIMRGERRLEIEVTRGRRQPSAKDVARTYIGMSLVALLLAVFIAFQRLYDPVARLGAWFIATASVAFGLFGGWAATWRHLPTVIGALLWIPQVSRFVAEGILVSFFASFPRRLFRARWPWVLVWAPVLATLPWRISAMYSVVYQPGHAIGAPEWIFRISSIRIVVYLVAGVVILALNYRRLADVNERRRVRVLVAGTTLAVLAAVAYVAIESLGIAALAGWRDVGGAFLYLLCLACPVAFAYAILRHRVMDIQVIIRQGLQYALARGALLSLVPMLAAVLVLDLLLHRNQPLVAIMQARGWVYVGLGALALTTYAMRRQWLEAVDRRFFREHYDAQRLLREVVEEVHEARDFEQVAPRVVARIEAALHPEFVALVMREPHETHYRSCAAAPAGQAPPPQPADSKLMALVRVLGKPLEVPQTESGWLQQQLPHEETDFLRQTRIDLVVPIAVSPERTEMLLVLGVKRSEEPYSREDQDLLAAVAASLALLLEKPTPVAAAASSRFEECPQCGTCYDTGSGQCAKEGTRLNPVAVPRLLSGRYRLERRLGRGGMGAVYEALDTALDRRVAVKLIRDDLVGKAEAAERFRREARTAASFTHPHVVTVHDFGVAAGTHPFLVMELLSGVTLREELQQRKRLTAARTLETLRGVCDALEAAHHRQLVHRDLKPENIFLARNEMGEVTKVLDFGLAKFLTALLPASVLMQASTAGATVESAPGRLVGTLLYMSPEQLQGKPVELSWDLWALAVVAYEMLTGNHPFARPTTLEWQTATLAGSLTPVSKYLSDAPGSWQQFFVRALALDPRERPASARMFLSELEQALSQPAIARPSTA